MLTLKDGPCEGTYMVKRAPVFLRAVLDKNGKKDVLDQIEDTPKASEKVFVYQLEGEAGWVHLKMAKRSQSGFYALGDYRYLPEVNGQELRDNAIWQVWATEQMAKLTKQLPWNSIEDTVETPIVPAYGSGAAEHRHAESIEEWKKRSEKGEVCGILGCPSKPTVKCPHCLNHYCDDHKFVIGGPGHPWRIK